MRLTQTRVGADMSAAGVCVLAGRTLGTGEQFASVNASHMLICGGRRRCSSHENAFWSGVHSLCVRVRAQKCEIFRWPLVRGCAEVKVYLKWLNEAASDGS